MSDNEMPDSQQIKEIFDVLEQKVPGLLEKLASVLYGAKESEQYGKAISTFYKTLIDAGMSKEQAFQLTRDYMSNLSLGSIVGGFKTSKRKDEEE